MLLINVSVPAESSQLDNTQEHYITQSGFELKCSCLASFLNQLSLAHWTLHRLADSRNSFWEFWMQCLNTSGAKWLQHNPPVSAEWTKSLVFHAKSVVNGGLTFWINTNLLIMIKYNFPVARATLRCVVWTDTHLFYVFGEWKDQVWQKWRKKNRCT